MTALATAAPSPAQAAPTTPETLARLNADKPAGAQVAKVSEATFGDARVEKFELGNGLTLILWEDHGAPVFAFQTWFGVGSRHEKKGKTGIAHLFEHLMFKATKNLEEGEFDQIMERHGAQTNASTWVDWTYYRQKLPAEHLELVFKLEADRMEHMILNQAQLDSEREVVKNERLLRVDNDPDGKMYEVLYDLAFDKHPYGAPTIGWMKDIDALTLEDCLAFYKTYYAPNGATIVIVGAIDTEETLALAQKYYGHMEAQPIPATKLPVEPPKKAERRKTLELAVASEKAVYAWHAPSVTDPSHPAMVVLDEILTGGESSRLYKLAVTERELASELHGWVPSWAEPGLYELGVTLRPGKTLAELEPVIEAALAELLAKGVTERELNKAKNGIEADFLRAAADTGSRARELGNAEVTAGDYRRFFGEMDRIRAVTAEDVLKIAQRVLKKTNRSVVIAVPAKEAE